MTIALCGLTKHNQQNRWSLVHKVTVIRTRITTHRGNHDGGFKNTKFPTSTIMAQIHYVARPRLVGQLS